MPVTEKQFLTNIRANLRTRNIWSVAIVSPQSEDASDAALIAEFGGSAHVHVHKSLELLKADASEDLDVLIVNKSLGKAVDDSDALDGFIKTALTALKLGGVLLIREDLSGSSDSKKVAKLTDYFDVFRTVINDKTTGFGFYAVNEVDTSIYVNSNWHDYYWTLTKQHFEPAAGDNVTFRDFLDKTQYTDTGIFAYEWIFGDNFISPGGWNENLAFLKRLGDMQPGQKMLDIGVGIGGGARQAASEFGLHVTGIDLSANMLSVALDRVHREKDARVQYVICNALTYQWPENTFDYVYSRDGIHHNPDMPTLFRSIYNCLKPGGKVLMTQYGTGYGKWSQKFTDYVAKRQYHLKNNEEMHKFAADAGFVDIHTENLTKRFEEILGDERSRVENNKEEFLSKFSQKEYDSLVNGWNDKIQYIADDNHNWTLIYCVKPQ